MQYAYAYQVPWQVAGLQERVVIKRDTGRGRASGRASPDLDGPGLASRAASCPCNPEGDLLPNTLEPGRSRGILVVSWPGTICAQA